MPRWEVNDAATNTHKFWELNLRGSNVELRYGRIGGRGQLRTKAFDDDDAARKAAVKMYRAKERDGYAYIEGTGARPEATPPRAPRVPLPGPLRDALRADPDAVEAHLVLSDFLLAQGDPLGELVALGVALHGETDVTRFLALQTKRDAILGQHQRHLLGALADHGPDVIALRWRLGLVRGATLRAEAPEAVVRACLDGLHAAPVTVALQDLALPTADADAVRAGLLAAGLPPTLRRLALGGEAWGHRQDRLRPLFELVRAHPQLSTLVIDDGAAAWACPRIERLVLRGGAQLPASGGWPALTALRLETDDLSALRVADRDMPGLERLEIETTHDGDHRRRLLASPVVPRLAVLRLEGEMAPDLAEAWRETRIGPRIELG